MMKKNFQWKAVALFLFAVASSLFVSCKDSETDDKSPTPAATLTAGSATSSTVYFNVTLKDANKCNYLYTESDAAIPSVAEIMASEKSISASGSTEINDMKASTKYRISAVASKGKATGVVVSLIVSTAAPEPQPAIELVKGTASQETLSFKVTLTETTKAAYLCVEKSENMTIPSALNILQTGTEIKESGDILATQLKSSTTYVIVAAGANGNIVSEVKSIEMSTQISAPTVTLTKGVITKTELTFNAVLNNAERAAYVCLEKNTITTLPLAADIIKDGTAITQSGNVTATGLKASTVYVIAVVAANKEVLSPITELEMTTEISLTGDAIFTLQAAGGYFGDTQKKSTGEYRLVLADGQTSDVNGIYATIKPGRAMSFNLYQLVLNTIPTVIPLPARSYKYATSYALNTFHPDQTYCLTTDEKGGISKTEFSAGTIKVEQAGTIYTITADLTTTTGESFKASYKGALKIDNKVNAAKPTLPQIEKDLVGLKFIRGLAKYYDNTETSENCIINLYDVEPKISGGYDYLFTPGGHMISLDLATALSTEMKLQEGTYVVGDTDAPGTYYSGYFLDMFGTVLSVGTYSEERNSDNMNSTWGLITSGTVKITKLATANAYRIEIDCKTDKNYKMTGTYEGLIEFTDIRGGSGSTSVTPASERAKALKLRR